MELLFPLLLVALLVPMFLGVRRQKREAEKVNTLQAGLKVGDRVTTTSGLLGTVVEADDTTVDLEIAEDVVTTWLRAAIRDVRTEDADAAVVTDADEPVDAEPLAATEAGLAGDTAVETTDGTAVEPAAGRAESANGTAAAESANGTAAATDGTTTTNGTGGSAEGAASGDAAEDPTRLTKD
ncbi:hypothetical protein NRB56_45590 [Nocardia sp. RB56]|uniref:Preprotein translocase subunit YajC n=1 Tax=Nocardia aurantia TaxID=2585199 RepID=A0A7K0DT68_9NOCA|nr:hypothetical protein [Nocardia aurantia]